MEDVLDVYKRSRDPKRPLVCLDETSKQLLADTRQPLPMKKDRPARSDYEYKRNGTANLFMDPKELGTRIKNSEVIYHHEVTNQALWNIL
jgi:hypothetical protein